MQIKKAALPQVPPAEEIPQTSLDELEQRYRRLMTRMDQECFSHVVIYGDREHFANLSYMTGGYDSRFEETLLVIAKDQTPVLIVGNEGTSYSGISRLIHTTELFQTFSLQGQTRDKKTRLHTLLRRCGLDSSARIGVVGMKYFEPEEAEEPQQTYDIPHYIVEELAELAPRSNLRNVTEWFTHPHDGLRTMLSEHEIALSEYMGGYLSEEVRTVLRSLRPGVTETEAASVFRHRGLPFSAHPVVSFGDEAVLLGLSSPDPSHVLRQGDPVNVAFGVRGANVARTGLAVSSRQELGQARSSIVEDFYFPYFEAMKAWYESLAVGRSSHEVYTAAIKVLGDSRFGVTLNPGHQIHLEEWINTPFRSDFDFPIRSGTALQCDIIAFPGGPYVGVHVEDSLVVAGPDLTKRLTATYPRVMSRIRLRQDMMRKLLGISVSDDVLPLSNIQAVLHPFLLDMDYLIAAK